MAFTGCWCLTTDIEIIDCRGLKCPLPVLKMEKRLSQLPAGASFIVLATDPMARIDIPLYCRQHGHACAISTEAEVMRFAIEKGGD